MTEHMQFIIPYIKGVRNVDSPGNLPSSPNVVNDEFNETDEVENTEENTFESTAESLNFLYSFCRMIENVVDVIIVLLKQHTNFC